MKFLNYIFVCGIVFQGILSCSEADREMFEGTEAINFSIPTTSDELNDYKKLDSTLIFRGDTIVYSFAFDLESTEQEICIPVEITGFASNTDRKYIIDVKEYAGIKAGVHYDALSREQILRAGKTRDSLKILFHRTDMDKQARKLGITIKSGEDFIEGPKERLFVAVQVSDILEKPNWWDSWTECFGTYHPIKYREWMRLYGGKGDLSGKRPDWWSSALELTLILDLKLKFEEQVFEDENGVRLVIPCTH